MKKTLMITLLSSAALMLFATSADAKTFDDQTDVGVSFKSDDPTVIGDNQPFKDNLSLVWKPSAFQFGEQTAVGNSATFSNTVEGNQYLVVNDDRADDALTGWKLTAKMSELKSASGAKTLASKLTFNLGTAQAYRITDDPTKLNDKNDYIVNKPDTEGVLTELEDAGIKLGDGASKSIELVAGDTTSKTILGKETANGTKGGVATLIKDTKLVVADAEKDNAAGESFTGTVTWTLDDLVQN
ncbi:WxL domain-containing protein [Enterococcus rotai]|uniref:WxL domain-containing protein n=1 Tax=Enterococcus rotai TaxID=118060 RepID=UPI0032B3A9ED